MTNKIQASVLKLTGLTVLAATFAASTANAQVIWSEEFDSGTQPNPAVWSYDLGAGGWGNSELQSYTNSVENVRIEGGNLIIAIQEEIQKGNRKTFTSGRIKSENKLTFQYGTIEARIKVPNLADGLWPAFWTLGNNFGQVGWPDCGELDVMEMGSASAISDGLINNRVSSTAHWEHQGNYASYGLSYDSPTPLNDNFHVYRMEWTPDEVTTYIDGQWIWTIDISPDTCTDCSEFHQPHFIILNLAVGGTYPGLFRASDITAPIPAEMHIDYVRISDNGHTILGGSSLDGGSGETGTSVQVSAINAATQGTGPNKSANVTVTVQDDLGQPVANAVVSGTFTGTFNETAQATSDANGVATLTSAGVDRQPSYTFCVDNITHPSLTYDASQNTQNCASL